MFRSVFTALPRSQVLLLFLALFCASCHGRKAAIPAAATEDGSRCCDGGSDAYDVPEVREPPSFPGGEAAMYAWIGNNLVLPAGVTEGTSWVQFNVACDGSLHDAFVKVGAVPELDSAAVHLVRSMPAWTPGKVKDKPVCVRYVLPVKAGMR